MSILFLFLSLYIGINIRVSIAVGVIEAILLLAFLVYRFSYKFALLCLGTLFLGVGFSFIRPSFQKSEYKCLVTEVKENYFIVSSSFEKMYVYEKSEQHEVGDILLIKGTKSDLSFSTIESGYDFKEYLNNKGIYTELKPTSINIIFSTPFRIFQLKKNFLSKFDENTASLVSLILFGNNIEGETTTLFRNLQLIRLISNTGVFLHLLFTIITFLLSYLIKDKYSQLIGILLMMVYSIFTYPRFVVFKFIAVKLMQWINEYLLKKKFNYLELLSFSAIGFLLLDYHLAYQDSFLLSYLIPIFVLFINGSFRKYKKIKKKIFISLMVFLSFVPFSLKYSNELSILSLPFQFILLPFTSAFGIGSFICFLGVPLYSGMNGFALFFNNLLTRLSPIFIKIYAPPMNSLLIIFYEAALILIVYLLSINLKDLYKIFIPIFTSCIIIYFLPIQKYINSSVTFINVGQGDSCLISYKNTSILIDTGGSKTMDFATQCLIPYFKKRQIYKLNYVITTHDDIDHSGALLSLQQNFKVNNVVKDASIFPLKVDDITINNLNTYTSLWSDDNDKSLVLYFSVSNHSFLIMGDAPKKIERKIIEDNPNLKANILKVGHHGSNTSTDEEFIKTIKPDEAIISCGKNNYYGHPHQETINILTKYKVTIRRTDVEGSVVYSARY